MRFLLLSDTYGKLGIINELAAGVRADAVIHAGDFGFYDDRSYERLSERELRLQTFHSELPLLEEGEILALPRIEKSKAADHEARRTDCAIGNAGKGDPQFSSGGEL